MEARQGSSRRNMMKCGGGGRRNDGSQFDCAALPKCSREFADDEHLQYNFSLILVRGFSTAAADRLAHGG